MVSVLYTKYYLVKYKSIQVVPLVSLYICELIY